MSTGDPGLTLGSQSEGCCDLIPSGKRVGSLPREMRLHCVGLFEATAAPACQSLEFAHHPQAGQGGLDHQGEAFAASYGSSLSLQLEKSMKAPVAEPVAGCRLVTKAGHSPQKQ